MRNSVGVLASVLIILILLPGFSLAGTNDHPKKYGLEIQIGGSFHTMNDVNNFVAEPGFIDPRYEGSDDENIYIGSQFGIGFLYRPINNFGWSFGYNRFVTGFPIVYEDKYRRNAYFTGIESWTEQTVAGSELYFLPVWYCPWNNKEVMFGVGPALYSASLDRSISIVRSEGSGANPAGSFSDATGMSAGLMIMGGVEFPFKHNLNLVVQVGARWANVGKLTYTDNQDVEQTIYKNNASNATLGVDFSGAFVKASIRTYFKPSSDWRTPKR